MSIRLIRLAAVYLVIGVTMGIVMGTMHQFTLAPVHAHINLLGFVIVGLFVLVWGVALAYWRLARVEERFAQRLGDPVA